ncbi:hypothetical protein N2152v2_010988 [Parachlorella kessleri]
MSYLDHHLVTELKSLLQGAAAQQAEPNQGASNWGKQAPRQALAPPPSHCSLPPQQDASPNSAVLQLLQLLAQQPQQQYPQLLSSAQQGPEHPQQPLLQRHPAEVLWRNTSEPHPAATEAFQPWASGEKSNRIPYSHEVAAAAATVASHLAAMGASSQACAVPGSAAQPQAAAPLPRSVCYAQGGQPGQPASQGVARPVPQHASDPGLQGTAAVLELLIAAQRQYTAGGGGSLGSSADGRQWAAAQQQLPAAPSLPSQQQQQQAAAAAAAAAGQGSAWQWVGCSQPQQQQLLRPPQPGSNTEPHAFAPWAPPASQQRRQPQPQMWHHAHNSAQAPSKGSGGEVEAMLATVAALLADSAQLTPAERSALVMLAREQVGTLPLDLLTKPQQPSPPPPPPQQQQQHHLGAGAYATASRPSAFKPVAARPLRRAATLPLVGREQQFSKQQQQLQWLLLEQQQQQQPQLDPRHAVRQPHGFPQQPLSQDVLIPAAFASAAPVPAAAAVEAMSVAAAGASGGDPSHILLASLLALVQQGQRQQQQQGAAGSLAQPSAASGGSGGSRAEPALLPQGVDNPGTGFEEAWPSVAAPSPALGAGQSAQYASLAALLQHLQVQQQELGQLPAGYVPPPGCLGPPTGQPPAQQQQQQQRGVKGEDREEDGPPLRLSLELRKKLKPLLLQRRREMDDAFRAAGFTPPLEADRRASPCTEGAPSYGNSPRTAPSSLPGSPSFAAAGLGSAGLVSEPTGQTARTPDDCAVGRSGVSAAGDPTRGGSRNLPGTPLSRRRGGSCGAEVQQEGGILRPTAKRPRLPGEQPAGDGSRGGAAGADAPSSANAAPSSAAAGRATAAGPRPSPFAVVPPSDHSVASGAAQQASPGSSLQRVQSGPTGSQKSQLPPRGSSSLADLHTLLSDPPSAAGLVIAAPSRPPKGLPRAATAAAAPQVAGAAALKDRAASDSGPTSETGAPSKPVAHRPPPGAATGVGAAAVAGAGGRSSLRSTPPASMPSRPSGASTDVLGSAGACGSVGGGEGTCLPSLTGRAVSVSAALRALTAAAREARAEELAGLDAPPAPAAAGAAGAAAPHAVPADPLPQQQQQQQGPAVAVGRLDVTSAAGRGGPGVHQLAAAVESAAAGLDAGGGGGAGPTLAVRAEPAGKAGQRQQLLKPPRPGQPCQKQEHRAQQQQQQRGQEGADGSGSSGRTESLPGVDDAVESPGAGAKALAMAAELLLTMQRQRHQHTAAPGTAPASVESPHSDWVPPPPSGPPPKGQEVLDGTAACHESAGAAPKLSALLARAQGGLPGCDPGAAAAVAGDPYHSVRGLLPQQQAPLHHSRHNHQQHQQQQPLDAVVALAAAAASLGALGEPPTPVELSLKDAFLGLPALGTALPPSAAGPGAGTSREGSLDPGFGFQTAGVEALSEAGERGTTGSQLEGEAFRQATNAAGDGGGVCEGTALPAAGSKRPKSPSCEMDDPPAKKQRPGDGASS